MGTLVTEPAMVRLSVYLTWKEPSGTDCLRQHHRFRSRASRVFQT